MAEANIKAIKEIVITEEKKLAEESSLLVRCANLKLKGERR